MYVEGVDFTLQKSTNNSLSLKPPSVVVGQQQAYSRLLKNTVAMFPVQSASRSRSFQQEQTEGHETKKHQEVNKEERPATVIQQVSQGALFSLRYTPGNSGESVNKLSLLNNSTKANT